VTWLAIGLLAALLLLQYRLWLSGDGVREVVRLRAEVASQQQQNATLAERNRELGGEVRDLKQGYAAIEERARAGLGMIAGNETFYQVVPRSPTSTASTSHPAPAVPGVPAEATRARVPALRAAAARP
jgi:cell division protein FtsB